MEDLIFQTMAICVLIAFYSVYIGKMILQRKKGIQTNQLGKGSKPRNVIIIEVILEIATGSIVVVQLISIFANISILSPPLRVVGGCIAAAGVLIFSVSVWTMRDSWRAGIAEKDNTKIVTSGIYRISRNPAFLGFDFIYIGLLLMFCNAFLTIFSAFAILMLHLQILQEETFLRDVFGEQYATYSKTVCRYLGRRSKWANEEEQTKQEISDYSEEGKVSWQVVNNRLLVNGIDSGRAPMEWNNIGSANNREAVYNDVIRSFN